MKKQYRYFEPLPPLKFDNNRFRVKQCPCGRSNKDGKFSPFVGYEDKGKCHSCGEKFLPELPKRKDNAKYRKSTTTIKPTIKPKTNTMETFNKQPHQNHTPIAIDVFKESILQSHQTVMDNYLSDFFLSRFDKDIVQEIMGKYYIGSSSARWHRATMFWLIDIQGGIRSGKIMLYNSNTGKRIKEPKDHITWQHKILQLEDFKLEQCFFGEHLLRKYPHKIVAIVESEKTALIASIYFPDFIWLATGGISNLSIHKCKVLEGRTVILYPDLKAYDDWIKIAKELSIHIKDSRFSVSTILEKNATEEERKGKLDLADYLLRFDYNSFINQQKQVIDSDASVDTHTISNTSIAAISTETADHYLPKINIALEDISVPCAITTTLTEQFNYFEMITMQLNNGKYLDCLFDSNSEPIKPNASTSIVKYIEDFFDKKFVPAIINEEHCLINWYSEPPKTNIAVMEKSTVANQQDDAYKKEIISTASYTNSIEHKASAKDWTKDIIEIEQYFSSITLPTAPIGLSQGMTITDSSAFVKSHLATVKANNGKQTFLPYLDRLKELKRYLMSSFKELLV